MLIRHLALSVRDPEVAAEFYLSVIGLDGMRRDEPWGCRLDLADGFMLALIKGEPPPSTAVGAVHFGAALETAEQARALRSRLRRAGVPEVEWEDSGDYVGVKVRDPDGYVVELYHDPPS